MEALPHRGAATAPIRLATNIPWTSLVPKKDFLAYSASKWMGLKSPVSPENRTTSASVIVFDWEAVSPTWKLSNGLNSIGMPVYSFVMCALSPPQVSKKISAGIGLISSLRSGVNSIWSRMSR